MALALLTLSRHQTLGADSPVIGAAQWQSLRAAQDVVRAAQAAVDAACTEAATSTAESVTQVLQEQAQAHEEQSRQALTRIVLHMQAELERTRTHLRDTFVQTQMSCLQSMLAGPLPNGFFERVVESARQWVGESASLALCVGAADEPTARAALQAADRRGQVQLQVDPMLGAGQCHLVTEFGRLEGSLDVQIEALHEALENWWQPAMGGPTDAQPPEIGP